MNELDFRVVIPARFASSRLPGKPLRTIAGREMVLRVWDRAMEAGAREVWVATDDTRIAAVVEAAGGKVQMTSPDHASGTDRLAEVASRLDFPDDAIVVNLQGDEPLIDPALLRALADALARHPEAGLATAATPITHPADVFQPNVVKVVVDANGLALYFSRAPIPWVREAFPLAPHHPLPGKTPFLRHLGLYAYRVRTLRALADAPVAPLEEAESLEQLRALHLGIRIHVSTLASAPPHGVDTEEDLARVEALFAGAAHGA